MDAVEILFGFYKTIPGFFQQVWGTAEEEPEHEAEATAQPEPEKPKLPVIDWPGLFNKILEVLDPFEEALWKVSDLVAPVMREYRDALRACETT